MWLPGTTFHRFCNRAATRFTAVDLPGHGANKKPDSVVTTQSYIQALVDVITPLDHPVILAGHSTNGALISHVAEQVPEKIERLIYVTAFLLKNGGSVFEAMEGDTDAEVFSEIRFSDDQAFATLPIPALLRVGLHDVGHTEIQRILPLMAEWQASEPFLTRLAVSNENFGSVPKTYIRTNIDKMISPALQNTMIVNWEVDSIFDLESGTQKSTDNVPDNPSYGVQSHPNSVYVLDCPSSIRFPSHQLDELYASIRH
ncbi:MAG: alpha/beta fold hydrolase [Gammaproteobacteria bacterium]